MFTSKRFHLNSSFKGTLMDFMMFFVKFLAGEGTETSTIMQSLLAITTETSMIKIMVMVMTKPTRLNEHTPYTLLIKKETVLKFNVISLCLCLKERC